MLTMKDPRQIFDVCLWGSKAIELLVHGGHILFYCVDSLTAPDIFVEAVLATVMLLIIYLTSCFLLVKFLLTVGVKAHLFST
jgi:hypothetical protein